MTDAVTCPSIVMVDANNVINMRHNKVKKVLGVQQKREDAAAVRILLKLTGVALTVPYKLKIMAEPDAEPFLRQLLEAEFSVCNNHWNEFNPESEIYQINHSDQVMTPLPISMELFELLKFSSEVTHRTHGTFDPAVKPLADFLIEHRVRRIRDLPTEELRDEAYRLQRFSNSAQGFTFSKDPSNRVITKLAAGAQLALSAISKGSCIDRVIASLRRHNYQRALFDWGGDIMATGSAPGTNEPWQVGIKAPNKDSYLRVMELRNEAIATSGDYENLFMGTLQEKISRTFIPFKAELLPYNERTKRISQATVRASSCALADALATAALVSLEFSYARQMLCSWRRTQDFITDYALYSRHNARLAGIPPDGSETLAHRKSRLFCQLPARVVVVGGGLAGCSAALEAARSGSGVVLLEKEQRLLGNSAKATSGINGVGTRPQARRNIDDTEKFFERDTFRSGQGGTCDISVVKMLATQAGGAVEWLMRETGLELSVISQLGGHSRARTHRLPDTPSGEPVPVGYTIMKNLSQRVTDPAAAAPGTVRVIIGATLTGILRQKNGELSAISGVSYKVGEDEFTLSCDSVVLATGGFSCGKELLKEFRPELMETPTTNGPWATGDGVQLARAIGAQLTDMHHIQLHPTGLIDPKEPAAPVKFLGPEALRGAGGILVNSNGKRFTDELQLRSVVTKAIHDQNNVFPESNGCRFAYCVLSANAAKSFGTANLNFYKSRKLFLDFPNLEDLSAYIGCSATTLLETVKTYEAACAAGHCSLTGKTVFPSDASSEPFSVALITPSIHYTMGGLAITPAGEVLAADDAPSSQDSQLFADCSTNTIPGLFAAGEVSACLHGANRLAGNSLLECVVFGRISGDRAASVLQKDRFGLSPDEWHPVVLRDTREGGIFGHGCRILHFSFPGPFQYSGMALGQFVAIRGDLDGEQLTGYYSPMSLPEERGGLTLVARADRGRLSEWISSMRPGDAVEMKIAGGIKLTRSPKPSLGLQFNGKPIRHLGLVAGGTGIAPMLQLIRAHTSDDYRCNTCTLHLVYAAEKLEELTYFDALNKFSDESGISCFFVLNHPPAGWVQGVGFIDKQVISENLPLPNDDTLLVLCGPRLMEQVVRRLARSVGHDPSMIRSVDDPGYRQASKL